MDLNSNSPSEQETSNHIPSAVSPQVGVTTPQVYKLKSVLALVVLLVVGIVILGFVYKYFKTSTVSSDDITQVNSGQPASARSNVAAQPTAGISKSTISKDCGSINMEDVFVWGVTGDSKSLTSQDRASAACMTESLFTCKPARQIGILVTENGKFNLRDEIFGIQGNTCKVHSEQASNTGFQLCMVPLSTLSTWKTKLAAPDYVKHNLKDSADYFYNTLFFAKISEEPGICTTTGPVPY